MFVETVKALTPDEAEAKRQEQRRDIRRQIAESELHVKRYQETRAEISALDRRADLAADEHQQRCLPAQERMRAIEQLALDAAADRVPLDASLESERASLLQLVRDENQKLAAAIAEIDLQRKPLQKKLDEFRDLGQANILRSKLASHELAHSGLKADHEYAQLLFKLLHAEAKRLGDGIKEQEQYAAARGQESNRAIYERRIKQAKPLLAKISAEAAKYRAECDRLYQQLIDE